MILALLKFIYRTCFHFGNTLLVVLPLQGLGAILLLPLAALYDIGELPRAFRWFDSADPHIGRNTDTIGKINKGWYVDGSETTSKVKLWWNKYIWLAWRNPLNHFAYTVLGVQIKNPTNKKYLLVPMMNFKSNDDDFNLEVGDNTGRVPGLSYSELTTNNKTYYEYYIVLPYSFRGTTKCIRIRIGYKLGDTFSIPEGKWTQQVFVFSPFHSFKGNY